ncbi:hypothetical protein [Amycolatopsis sp. YIM 10]|uniref:hypothetical protein n=1 Tax=Amycolatopsis sp. YIM 10 TaxID=2653857 RepID=UPI0012907B01|nr:hypothetical protein [Amycolatopsis sp. YIM 10]
MPGAAASGTTFPGGNTLPSKSDGEFVHASADEVHGRRRAGPPMSRRRLPYAAGKACPNPTGTGRARWTMRRRPVSNAVAITAGLLGVPGTVA